MDFIWPTLPSSDFLVIFFRSTLPSQFFRPAPSCQISNGFHLTNSVFFRFLCNFFRPTLPSQIFLVDNLVISDFIRPMLSSREKTSLAAEKWLQWFWNDTLIPIFFLILILGRKGWKDSSFIQQPKRGNLPLKYSSRKQRSFVQSCWVNLHFTAVSDKWK